MILAVWSVLFPPLFCPLPGGLLGFFPSSLSGPVDMTFFCPLCHHRHFWEWVGPSILLGTSGPRTPLWEHICLPSTLVQLLGFSGCSSSLHYVAPLHQLLYGSSTGIVVLCLSAVLPVAALPDDLGGSHQSFIHLPPLPLGAVLSGSVNCALPTRALPCSGPWIPASFLSS